MSWTMAGEIHWVFYLIGLGLLLLAVGVLVRLVGGTYWRFRGTRVITCPENRQPAAVEVDARHAAATAFRPLPELRLKDCSRWPEMQGCGQECLRQIEAAPEGCLVRNILTAWYQGKSCAYCGKPFEKIDWLDNKPALLTPERTRTVEWSELRAEEIPDLLRGHLPVCWNCHMAETFRRQHPELVTDRDPRWSSDHEKRGRRRQWIH